MDDDLPLATGACTVAPYRRGVARLLDADPAEAAEAFRAAVRLDAGFALGHAGLAVAASELHDDELVSTAITEARRCTRGISRRERQHVAVVALVLEGRLARGSALGREHLAEYPSDVVVHRLLAGVTRMIDGAGDQTIVA